MENVTLSKSASVWRVGGTRYVIDPEKRIMMREGADGTPTVTRYASRVDFDAYSAIVQRLGKLES